MELKIISLEDFKLEINRNKEDCYSKQEKSKIKLAAPKGLYEKLYQYYDINKEVVVSVGNFNFTFEINAEYLLTSYVEKIHYEKKKVKKVLL